jgi:hypothetical protein
MATRKPPAKRRPAWEEQASHAAKVLDLPETEMKNAVREALMRQTASTIVERHCRQLVQEAASARAQDPVQDDAVERRVRDEKAWFPND